MTATRNAVLELELERFRYSGAEHDTLAGICLSLAPGSLTAIVGDSGSGKSTLGAVLAGMLPRHDGDDLEGCITLAGQEIRHGAGADPRIDPVGWARHVGMLPQDARHYLSGVRETVEEELALGLENAGVPRADMRLGIAALARKLGIDSLLNRDSGKLSGGQERLVALAALALGAAPVLVLDEPLAGLDASAATQVSTLLGHLRSEGTALVLLTRSLDGLAAGADRVLSLRAGSTSSAEGADVAGSVPAPPPAHRNPRAGAALLLEFASTELGYAGSADPVVAGLDLQVRAGECVALAGPNGAGKTTVLKAAAGLLRPGAGRVVDHARPGGSIGLLMQNPSDQLFERTVRREVAFGLPKRGPQAARVPEVLATLGLAAEAETHPYELPASARRLVALATVLVRDPSVLLLDEPTEALDAEGVARLRGAIGKVLDRGGAVLFSTHDEAFMAATAHRVHRMEPARAARA